MYQVQATTQSKRNTHCCNYESRKIKTSDLLNCIKRRTLTQYFPHSFIATSHLSLVLMSIYCRRKFIYGTANQSSDATLSGIYHVIDRVTQKHRCSTLDSHSNEYYDLVTEHSLIHRYQCFAETCCPCLHRRRFIHKVGT
jgi:hypothetical protein